MRKSKKTSLGAIPITVGATGTLERKISYMSTEKRDIEEKDGSISDIVAGSVDDKVEKELEKTLKKGFNAPYARVLFRLGISLLLVASIGVFATGVLKYQELMREKAALEQDRDDLEVEIDELKYLIDCPVDRDYIIRVAREKLGLNLPDEIVYYNDYNDDKK